MSLGMARQPTQGKNGARSFTQAIYARYSRVQAAGPDFLRQDGRNVFSPTLFRLIKSDVEATPQGFAGRLDFDPICSCQDPDGLRVETITVDPQRTTLFSRLWSFVTLTQARRPFDCSWFSQRMVGGLMTSVVQPYLVCESS
jgi:hypothetical protein